MKTSRRDFVKTGVIAAVGTALLPAAACISPKPKKERYVGVQLYSVRDDMMKDPVGSLTQLAKMGYIYVEHANYVDQKFYGYSAVEFRKVLDDLDRKSVV